MRCRLTVTRALIAPLTLLLLPCVASGDGAGILVQKEGDRLITGLGDNTPGNQQIGTRIFSGSFGTDLLTKDPSFFSLAPEAAGLPPLPGDAESLPTAAHVMWDFLPMHVAGQSANLFYWDGVGNVAFTPADDAKLTLYDPNFNSAVVDGAASAVPGLRLGTTTGDYLNLHAHRSWYLEGKTNPTAPPSGVYATAVRVRVGDLTPTKPIFVALSTSEVGETTLSDATGWLDANLDDLILRGDYNFNGGVDADDFALWLSQYGASTPAPVDIGEADGNYDGLVDALDYAIWRENATLAPTPRLSALGIPEPTAAGMLATVCLLLPRRARRPHHRRH